LVLLTTGVVAVLTHAVIPGLTWPVAFALGAIVSPPDAVAATSIIARLPVPRRISVILEGESLVNDATALTAYRVAVALAVSGASFSLFDASRDLLVASVGGVIVGWGVATVAKWLYRAIDDSQISITISFLSTFVAYLRAERIHGSGIVAVVVFGLIIGRWDHHLPARVRVEGVAIWRQVTALLNGLVFVLIGLQLPGILDGVRGLSITEVSLYGMLVSCAVVVIRILWNAIVPRVMRPFTRGTYQPLSWQETTVVGWAGMRGVTSLATALALPLRTDDGTPLPQRDLVIFLAFTVILSTLLLQGLTLPALIRFLGITGDDDEGRIRSKARLVAVRGALRRLDGVEVDASLDDEVQDIRRHYEVRERFYENEFYGRPDADVLYRKHAISSLRADLIDAESAALVRLRDDEYINDRTLREIRRDLDLERLRLGNRSSLPPA